MNTSVNSESRTSKGKRIATRFPILIFLGLALNSYAIDCRRITPSSAYYIEPHPYRAHFVIHDAAGFEKSILAHALDKTEVRQKTESAKAASQTWLPTLGINFDKETVIAVFLGAENLTPGAQLLIENIREESNRLRVDYAIRDGVSASERPTRAIADVLVCPKQNSPVIFYRNGVSVGYSHAFNLERVEELAKRKRLSERWTVTPLSGDAVALAYPETQFFGIEFYLKSKYAYSVARVDADGQATILEDGDLGRGLAVKDRDPKLSTAAVFSLKEWQRAAAAGYKPEQISCRASGATTLCEAGRYPFLMAEFDHTGQYLGYRANPTSDSKAEFSSPTGNFRKTATHSFLSDLKDLIDYFVKQLLGLGKAMLVVLSPAILALVFARSPIGETLQSWAKGIFFGALALLLLDCLAIFLTTRKSTFGENYAVILPAALFLPFLITTLAAGLYLLSSILYSKLRGKPKITPPEI